MQLISNKKTFHLSLRYMLLLCFTLLALFLSPLPALAKPIPNLTLIVPSCDKYSEAWKPFFTFLFKYWPNFEQKIYLIGNNNSYDDKRVTNILIPNEKSWSDNMLTALDQIEEDYILFMHEDYFLLSPVNVAEIEKLFKVMQKEKAAYLHLASRPVATMHPTIPNLGYLSKEQNYRTANQVVIWDKAVLKSLLKSGENPWEFELDGTVRSRAIDRPFMSVTGGNAPVAYLGAIWRGYWMPNAIELIEKENIAMEYKLPICSKMRSFIMNDMREFASTYFVRPIKKMLGLSDKRILPTQI